jgi:hypothetical protein
MSIGSIDTEADLARFIMREKLKPGADSITLQRARLPFTDFPESTPDAPGADIARVFSQDNGAGKTQLCVRFPTGAVQVIATEP